MKSQGKDAVVSARKPARGRFACVPFRWRGTATGLVVGGGVVLGGNAVSPSGGNAASGAVMLSPAHNTVHLNAGEVFAQNNLAAAFRLVTPGVGVGFADRSAAPYVAEDGTNYIFTARHTYESILPFATNGYHFEITRTVFDRTLIATATGEDVFPHSTDDFSIIKLSNNIFGTTPTRLAPFISGNRAILAGIGDHAYLGDAAGVTDKKQRVWEMDVGVVNSNGSNLIFDPSSDLDWKANAFNRHSGGGAYSINSSSDLDLSDLSNFNPSDLYLSGIMLTQVGGTSWGSTGVYNLTSPSALSHIQSVTVPEPAAAMAAAAGLGLLARRRMR